MRKVLTRDQVDMAALAVESRFNHVIRTVNTMSLQNILETVGFTTFKLRHVGRYGLLALQASGRRFAFT